MCEKLLEKDRDRENNNNCVSVCVCLVEQVKLFCSSRPHPHKQVMMFKRILKVRSWIQQSNKKYKTKSWLWKKEKEILSRIDSSDFYISWFVSLSWKCFTGLKKNSKPTPISFFYTLKRNSAFKPFWQCVLKQTEFFH